MDDLDTIQSLQKSYLSPNIKFLGDILGEVLIEQSSRDLFDKEEDYRSLGKEFRENNNLDAFKELKFKLSNLPNSEKSAIIKAFSTFFKLANLAEEYYKIKVNNLKEKEEENTNSFTYAVNFIKRKGLKKSDVDQFLENLKIQLVWTAHPTEARRLTIMQKLRGIYDLLNQLQGFKPSSHEYYRIRNKIKELLTLMWQSDELREDKVELLDEVRTVLWYFNNSVFDVIPELYQHLWQHLKEAGLFDKSIIDLPKFLEFGSWVGGDRDGHPGVTADVTIQTLLLHKRLCLRKYRQMVEDLIQHLSSSTNTVGVNEALEMSIVEDEKQFPEFTIKTSKLNQLERYRRKLDLMRLKLENSLKLVEKNAVEIGLGETLVGSSDNSHDLTVSNLYNRSNEFFDDLMIIYNSLIDNNGEIIARGLLSELIVKVQIFGFHLAPLDLRQDSEVHFSTITEIFNNIGLEDLKQFSKADQCKILLRELKNPRPLGVTAIYKNLTYRSKEVIKTLEVASDSIETISPRSISTYIISMATHERDVIGLMLLMKEIGLIEITNNKIVKAFMDIAPLFETKDDLTNAPKVMERLYNLDIYKSYLNLRKNTQEIMIGYSDSTKDVGIVGSNFRLVTAQQNLVRITNDHDYKIRIFHGRGGSVSRGGGPTNKALLAMPPNTVFDVKITEQGEVIGQNYANKQIAQTHLEGITSAMIVRGYEDSQVLPEQNGTYLGGENLEIFEELSNLASKSYEEMVKQNEKFIPFYLKYTPLDLIERATIGSRPSRRTKSSVSNIGALRAIPWIFSWSQTRLIFPGYFGLGTALNSIKETKGLGKLIRLYQSYPYFESMINNIQMVMLKADLNIAKLYLDLISENNEDMVIFERLIDEYKLTKRLILEVSQSNDLLSISPDIANSIRRRNPYLDPLSIIQVVLLKEWRNEDKPENMDINSVQRLLLQTLNGIAAGLKNTG